MSQPETAHVIVARPLHPQPEWTEKPEWQPVAYADSLEEAWAALDLIKEREREALHDPEHVHPHEREYDVWSVERFQF